MRGEIDTGAAGKGGTASGCRPRGSVGAAVRAAVFLVLLFIWFLGRVPRTSFFFCFVSRCAHVSGDARQFQFKRTLGPSGAT